MNTYPSTPNLTATRIVKGTKTFVVLSLDGAEVARMGGKRAERAAAVVVRARKDHDTNTTVVANGFAIEGCRGNLDSARTEAARLATTHERRVQNYRYTVTAADWAVAVEVEG